MLQVIEFSKELTSRYKFLLGNLAETWGSVPRKEVYLLTFLIFLLKQMDKRFPQQHLLVNLKKISNRIVSAKAGTTIAEGKVNSNASTSFDAVSAKANVQSGANVNAMLDNQSHSPELKMNIKKEH